MGILIKNKDKKSSKHSSLKKLNAASIKRGFKTLTTKDVESDRSSAYSYLL